MPPAAKLATVEGKHPRYQAHITIMTLVEVATDFCEIKKRVPDPGIEPLPSGLLDRHLCLSLVVIPTDR